MTLYKRALQVINNYYNTYSGLTVPTIVKTVAASGDYFIGIDSTNTPYKISKADLLAGLSSGGSGGSSGGGTTPTWNGTVVFKSLFNATPPTDVALDNTISLIGTASVDSSVVLLSGSSLLTGNAGYASIPNRSDYNFGNSTFVIDFFIRFVSVAPAAIINKYGGNASNSTFAIQLDSTGVMGVYFYSGSGYVGITSIPVAVNTLYHIGIKRVDGVISVWVNGVQKGTASIGTSNINNTNANILIGSEPGGTYYGNFRMDNLRITVNGNNDLSVIPTS